MKDLQCGDRGCDLWPETAFIQGCPAQVSWVSAGFVQFFSFKGYLKMQTWMKEKCHLWSHTQKDPLLTSWCVVFKIDVYVHFGCAEPSLGPAREGCSPDLACGLLAPVASVAEHGLSSGGPQALLPHGRSGLPRPGIEPVAPALAGGFLTIGPQGSPASCHIYSIFFSFE